MRPIVSAQHASVNFLAAENVSIVTAATLRIDFAWSIMRFSLRVGEAGMRPAHNFLGWWNPPSTAANVTGR